MGKDDDTGSSKSDGDSPPAPVGFWHPKLKHVRHEAMGKWLLTTVVLMAFLLAVLSLFWGAFNHIDRNISALVVYVVDFDGQVAPFDATGRQPIVGPVMSRVAEMQNEAQMHLGWVTKSPSEFNNDPMQVRQAIYNFDAWAAVIINPNATAMLYSAIENGNSSYDPRGAVQLVYMDSRDDTNWFDFIFPLASEYVTEATAMVGEEWARTALRAASSNETLLANLGRVPQAMNPAVGVSMFNLRPFYPYTIIPAITVALIYLIIVSFFSFNFYLPIHKKYITPEGHPPLHYYQFIIWRWVTTIIAYLFLSLAFSLVSLAFQINFAGYPTSPTSVTPIAMKNPTAYGHGTFVVYWMLNWIGMIALGLASENVAMIIGAPWVGLWLIFWVITNVVSGFYDIDIEPAFYRWGYAWPLHQIVEGTRQILFDLHSRIGLNFGVLFAWVAVNSVLFPVCCYIMRIKNKKGVKEYWA